LEDARQFAITESMLSGDWERREPKVGTRDFTRHFDDLWFTNTPGATLTFKFKGSAAGILDLMGPDTGKMKITVDGEDKGTRAQVDPWSYYQRLAVVQIVSGVEADKVHTVTVELLPDAPDRSVPIAEAKKADRYNADEFEGVALRFAWLRIIGELVD